MFDFVTKHKRLLQLLLVIVIIPPFAFWGIESYQRFGSATDIAEFEGQKITEQEFSEQLRQQQDRMRALLGAKFSPSLLDNPGMRAEILEGMISQRLLLQRALRGRLAVTDDQLRETITAIPAFQEGGKFSKARYEEALRREGMSPARFESSLRHDLILQQMTSAIGDSGVASRSAARQMAALRAERREVAEQVIAASAFAPQVKIAPEAVQAYYEANRARFQVPERVKAEYVAMTADALLALEPVSAEEVKNSYQSNIDRYQEKEQRQASHILVAVKPDASAEDKAKAREKAESLLAQARKAPSAFAELAKKNSDDPGSAAKGGDLGYFSRGMMVKPFEDAVFSLKAGEFAGPVESQFGYHVIRLTGIKAGKTRSLEEVRPEIERDLKKQRAGRKFAEAAEAFSNLVYEQSDSLKPAAEKYRLQIRTSDWITRAQAPIPQLNNPKLLAALFGEDAVKNRRNTEAVEVAPGTLVSARVVEREPAKTRPLEEVRDEIAKQLTQAEAVKLAYKAGAEKLEALKKGNASAAAFGPNKTVSRDDRQGVRAEAIGAVFRAERAKLPVYASVESADGYVLLRISRVIDGEVDEAKQKSVQAELARAAGARELQAYLSSLRASAKVEINKALLEKKQQ
ncbi:MAG: SurA N-terminal domain-containing protein [Betaproteobacteria bacterium]|nr:SurA N-terminal domain-containing protein [Betaproteobacteria bacterium]